MIPEWWHDALDVVLAAKSKIEPLDSGVSICILIVKKYLPDICKYWSKSWVAVSLRWFRIVVRCVLFGLDDVCSAKRFTRQHCSNARVFCTDEFYHCRRDLYTPLARFLSFRTLYGIKQSWSFTDWWIAINLVQWTSCSESSSISKRWCHDLVANYCVWLSNEIPIQ